MHRASIQTLPFLLPAVLSVGLVICCCTAQLLAAEESVGKRKTHSLGLFMSAKEQRDVEQEQRDMEEMQQSAENEAAPENIEPDRIAADTSEYEPDDSDDRHNSLTDNSKSVRYDGVLLKGDKVLSVWFDGRRHSGTFLTTETTPAGTTPARTRASGNTAAEIQIETVYPDGQLELSSASGGYRLFVGEIVPGGLVRNADSLAQGTDSMVSQ